MQLALTARVRVTDAELNEPLVVDVRCKLYCRSGGPIYTRVKAKSALTLVVLSEIQMAFFRI